jgi:hypothetical protein
MEMFYSITDTFCPEDTKLQEKLFYRRRSVMETFCYGDVLLQRSFVWRRFVEEAFCAETFCMWAENIALKFPWRCYPAFKN